MSGEEAAIESWEENRSTSISLDPPHEQSNWNATEAPPNKWYNIIFAGWLTDVRADALSSENALNAYQTATDRHARRRRRSRQRVSGQYNLVAAAELFSHVRVCLKIYTTYTCMFVWIPDRRSHRLRSQWASRRWPCLINKSIVTSRDMNDLITVCAMRWWLILTNALTLDGTNAN